MEALPSSIARRDFLATSVLGAVVAALPSGPADAAMVAPPPALTSPSSGDTSIRPFHYRATAAELADLKRRIKATTEDMRDTFRSVRNS